MARAIPHINLHDYHSNDRSKKDLFIKTLGDGLKGFGFLTVEGHGIEENQIEDFYSVFKDFFALEQEAKSKYDQVLGGARGYTPFGREHAKDSPLPDLKEFWHVGQELIAEHPYHQDYPKNIWPAELPSFQEKALCLYRSLEQCAETMLEALALYFELPHDTFVPMMKDGDSILRALHYPPLQEGVSPNAVRAAAHEDINLITLLCESKGSGLEVLTHENNWLEVDALAGDLVVDSGDMISRVTNGVIPATRHRVRNPKGGQNKARYSMPFFVHPYAKCDLSVLPRFIEEGQEAKFAPITAREFLNQRLQEIGLKKGSK